MIGTTSITPNMYPFFQFSTDEQKTPFKWIDGKDLYCKILKMTTGYSEGTAYTVATNVDQPVLIQFIVSTTSESPYVWTIGNYYCSGGDRNYSYCRLNNGTLTFMHRSGSSYAYGRTWVICFYTKK